MPRPSRGCIDFEEPDVAVRRRRRWRRRHEHALLVLDQFEELFTQSPPEVQERFAQLLGAARPRSGRPRAARRCATTSCSTATRFESLAPIFSELTPIGPPTGAALRRALVQPALKCGYRFEDETIVDEMLARSRASAARCRCSPSPWRGSGSARDRERGLLTRAAYDGDRRRRRRAGAARRSDARAHRPGSRRRSCASCSATWSPPRARAPRSSATSCCRCSRTRRDASRTTSRPRQVLDALVDARLLTSYELPIGRGRGAGQPPDRDRPRVAADGVAAPGALADAGSGRRAAARPAAPGRAAVGRARQARGPAVDRHVVPRVRALARALRGHAVGERGHVRARDDGARAAPPAPAACWQWPPSSPPRSSSRSA